jgi:hypothetical protein
MRGWKEEGKWLKAARELDFTPEQRKRVLSARDEALGILHECAPGLLLPVKSGSLHCRCPLNYLSCVTTSEDISPAASQICTRQPPLQTCSLGLVRRRLQERKCNMACVRLQVVRPAAGAQCAGAARHAADAVHPRSRR